MGDYQIHVTWSEEDCCFLAEIPELPGCIADGATEEEARLHALESAERWVKMAHSLGREVPIPVKADDALSVAYNIFGRHADPPSPSLTAAPNE